MRQPGSQFAQGGPGRAFRVIIDHQERHILEHLGLVHANRLDGEPDTIEVVVGRHADAQASVARPGLPHERSVVAGRLMRP